MKVLFVDDEEDIRKIGRLSLEAVGKLQVRLAASASEALSLARSEKPDVIVMDIMMPEMDGLAALDEIRRDAGLQAIPVVFMTARVQRAEVDQYLRAGAIGVIRKPFDPLTLPDEIKQLVATQSRRP